jgi:hypothetical protein
MLIIPPPKFRQRRGRVKGTTALPPAPVALTLVSASFDPGGLHVFLTFDRAIDVAGLHADQIAVASGLTRNHYVGDPAGASVSGAMLTLLMDITSSSPAGLTLLFASATTGIVAVNDGGTWAGADTLVLPFGE